MFQVEYPTHTGGSLAIRTFRSLSAAHRFMESEFAYWCHTSCIGWRWATCVRLLPNT